MELANASKMTFIPSNACITDRISQFLRLSNWDSVKFTKLLRGQKRKNIPFGRLHDDVRFRVEGESDSKNQRKRGDY